MNAWERACVLGACNCYFMGARAAINVYFSTEKKAMKKVMKPRKWEKQKMISECN
jgi:hypothetical protein